MASIILTGNLSEGFRALGPFPDHDAAAGHTLEGWIMTLEAPKASASSPASREEIDEIGDLAVLMSRAAEGAGYTITDEVRLALFGVAGDLVIAKRAG
jgi:hypothetical protein